LYSNYGIITVMSKPSGEQAVQFTAVPFDQLGSVALQPFQVVTDVPRISGFKTIEERACIAVLRPYYSPQVEDKVIFGREGRIYGDRITQHLRPSRFNGTLTQGYAAVLPFDASRAAELDTTARGRVERGKLSDETPGLTMVYGGKLYSSRRGFISELFLESMVYLERPITLYRSGSSGSRSENYLRRVIGPETFIERAAEAAVISEEESVANALKRARFALTHIYPGGLPGSRR